MKYTKGSEGGCLRRHEVNLGYYPMTATEAVSLRVAPHPKAPVVDTARVGANLGAQSEVNPSASNNPPLRVVRAEGEEWIYVYKNAGRKSGWIPCRAARLQTLEEAKKWACRGIAGYEFCVGRDSSRPVKPARFRLGRKISGKAKISAKRKVYLRASAGAAPTGFLEPGALVQLNWSKLKGLWVCVTVLDSKWVPSGEKGWVLGRYLERI